MNDIAVKVFGKNGHCVLDTGPTMSMRVDAHPCSNNFKSDPPYEQWARSSGDCNHFCSPGPPDVMLDAIEAEVADREAEKKIVHHVTQDVSSLVQGVGVAQNDTTTHRNDP